MMGNKKVVITYGTYDLFHHGHQVLLERAKELGDYLIVGVTSDAFDKERGKLNVHQTLVDRIKAVEETGLADKIVVEEFKGQKISDIIKFGVDVFTVGSDWLGKFDYLKKYCDVVYLERTQGVSSTELRADKIPGIKIGCIGFNYISERFVNESCHVGGVQVIAGFDAQIEVGEQVEFCKRNGIERAEDLDSLFRQSDAVYISTRVDKRSGYIEKAIESNLHVLCESPLFLSVGDTERLISEAEKRGLVVMEALKTRFYPAFEHLKLLLESGVVGEVKDIDASFSHVFDELDKDDAYQGAFYDMAGYALLPAMDFLGPEYDRADIVCCFEKNFCTWAKCALTYPFSSATLKVGRGMKTEGHMVITGTEGYVYVPAPWWKMEYFEIRGEDLRDIKKYYYACSGEGMRYELYEFTRRIVQPAANDCMPWRKEMLSLAKLMGQFDTGKVTRLQKGRYSFGGGETVEC